jgi:hypothetical protein
MEKDCFASLRDWVGTAETYSSNLKRLFIVADYSKKLYPSAVEEITMYNERIIELFNQTKNYASVWNSSHKEKLSPSADEYGETTEESWDALDKWTASQEKLRQEILYFMELLYSVPSKP